MVAEKEASPPSGSSSRGRLLHRRPSARGPGKLGLAVIDLAIVLAFVVYSVSVGFLSRKKASEDLEQYFLAGRTLAGS